MTFHGGALRNRRPRGIPAAMRITIAFAALILALPAAAHMPDRPDLNSWFASLKSSGGDPCCSYSDSTLVKEGDWDTVCDHDRCHYRVLLDGWWVDVPERAVIREPNRYGAALVWPWRDGGKWMIRCFIPGAGT